MLPSVTGDTLRQRVIESVSRPLDLAQRLFPQAAPVLDEFEPWMARPRFVCSSTRSHTSRSNSISNSWGSCSPETGKGWKLSSLSQLMEEEDYEDAARHTLWQ